MSITPPIEVKYLGFKDYHQVWALQKQLQRELIDGVDTQTLLLCEHPAVITMGRSAEIKNILAPQELLQQKGIEVCQIERGGDVTYHGPGQLVAYPILNLHNYKCDVGWYMRLLEECVIETLNEFGLESFRIKGKTGVWTSSHTNAYNTSSKSNSLTEPAKISSIGVRISRWCTMHGVSINVKDCTDGFELINPCGLGKIEISSLAQHQIEVTVTETASVFSKILLS